MQWLHLLQRLFPTTENPNYRGHSQWKSFEKQIAVFL